ncbi:MAG: excinuclease ABC subunit UvrA [Oligoflexales bacterium]|nr:excinuclease ABC subunit UvrA [Oligoflexales bacterium]
MANNNKQNDAEFIIVSGAREHNLKNVTARIPKNKLVVFTGVSGSGKSSLAFDTIFAEGQRRYVESLSAYARQFLGQMDKPKYESIRGLSPSISIDQKSSSKNPRSTVGTITEVYDYLRVLFARLGVQNCHICGKKVGRGDAQSMSVQISKEFDGAKIHLLAPIVDHRKGEHRELFQDLQAKGYSRVRVNGVLSLITELGTLAKHKKHSIEVLVDRLQIDKKPESIRRLTDSIETTLKLGAGRLICTDNQGKQLEMSEELSCCGFAFPKLDPPRFSFNSPLGMCVECNGLGSVLAVDPDKLIADPTLSIAQGAIAPWKNYFEESDTQSWSFRKIKAMEQQWGLDLHTPWNKLKKSQQELILRGESKKKLKINWESENSKGEFSSGFEGLLGGMMRRYRQTHSETMRSYYAKFMSNKPCQSCQGKRLKPEILAVTLGGLSIADLTSLTIAETHSFISKLALNSQEKIIASELIREINSRLRFLLNVGLSYLSLDRKGPSLSGGESQRIRLASQIGSELTGVLYVLDEPSIGLHQKDNRQLLETLKHLRDIGNSVLVVEHDYDTINEADWAFDFGPGAGKEGGEIVASCSPKELPNAKRSITGAYLGGRLNISRPPESESRSLVPIKNWLEIIGADENNLKNIDVKIPLGRFVCITGVSGAGKSTLVNQILFPFLSRQINKGEVEVGKVKTIKGYEHIDKVVDIDQKPIGRTPRSNPATYTKLFDLIRDLFAELPDSKLLGFNKGRFSFNVKGGRCEACSGDGFKTVEMHFLPDVYVPCEVCNGRRFNDQTLAVKYRSHSIADILDLSVDEATNLFQAFPQIKRILKTMQDVGLSYMSLGQSATTLSGGEAQRIKLARELAKRDTGKTFYILDEPTTGLHFDDIAKLLRVLHALVNVGNTVLVIEHNLDVIKTADWIIDLGPEGGERGGEVLAEGAPKDICRVKKSYTGQYLKKLL